MGPKYYNGYKIITTMVLKSTTNCKKPTTVAPKCSGHCHTSLTGGMGRKVAFYREVNVDTSECSDNETKFKAMTLATVT